MEIKQDNLNIICDHNHDPNNASRITNTNTNTNIHSPQINQEIKHLVISGGGPSFIQSIGVIQEAEKQGLFNIKNIQTIFASSAGAIVALCICLYRDAEYSWETINNYMINRQWQDVFAINMQTILESYTRCGLFHTETLQKCFQSFFEARNISLNITLKDFYDSVSKIELHFLAFELNSFQLEDISWKTHPNITLFQALHMTCSLPIMFSPVIIDIDTPISVTTSVTTSAPTSAPLTSTPLTSTPLTSTPLTSTPLTSTPLTSTPLTSTPLTSTPLTPLTSTPLTPSSIPTTTKSKCYLDGGIISNYPIKYCIQLIGEQNAHTILGIKNVFNDISNRPHITKTTSIFEYLMTFTLKFVGYIQVTDNINIPNEIPCFMDFMSIDSIKSAISESETRRELIEKGRQKIREYMTLKNKLS